MQTRKGEAYIAGQTPVVKIHRETLRIKKKVAEPVKIKEMADKLNEKYGHEYRKG